MKKIFKYQGFHLLAYLALGAGLILFSAGWIHDRKTMLGLTAFQWIVISWAAAGLFQAWIVVCWRSELYFGKISALFGKSGFPVFRAGFVLLGAIRLLPLIPISMLTQDSMGIVQPLRIALIAVTTPLILWAIYSVFFYFGINRAFGADHFFPGYRKKTLEKRGMFRYIPNSMYVILLLALYHPGLFCESSLGLAAAFIHHLFVWVHYFCTERPDMREIYGPRQGKE